MKYFTTVRNLVTGMVPLALVATAAGLFTSRGPGTYTFTSIHGQKVLIYGKGIYRHMSAEVAPQGIAQDIVTMGIGIPLLILSLYLVARGSLKGRFLLAGTLFYFVVTYLFYLTMGMYNSLFLVYALLLSLGFFAFLLTLLSFKVKKAHTLFKENLPAGWLGSFLVFNAVTIALLWLSVVVPPLISGTVPVEVAHYTTLIVQGLDLSLLLPAAFVSGVLLIRKKSFGYLLAPVYLVFMSILMTALTAKVIAMALAGAHVFPVIILIPAINLIALLCTAIVIKNIRSYPGKQSKPFRDAGSKYPA